MSDANRETIAEDASPRERHKLGGCATIGYCRECDDERVHRVALLRSDEVAYLNREVSGHLGLRACCPHLGVFHTHGRRSSVCNIDGCGCMEIDEQGRDEDAQRALSQERDLKHDRSVRVASTMLGFALGVLTCVVFTIIQATLS